ncbi:hypothetical protein [Priestia sp. J2]|uniref:hypothetical protein n=1 Tax=Priestia sp. J2 TaxID=2886505 RepID=UPI001E5A91A6|nr:hypothetical protein [Priestia sp. J2]
MTNLTNVANMEKGNAVYIKSVEAADLFSHMNRGHGITNEYLGMLPYSLESIQLEQEGMKVKKSKEAKWTSDDVINVKFNKKVRNADELLINLNENINNVSEAIKNETDKKKLEKLNDKLAEMNERKEHIQANKDNAEWKEIKSDDLRYKLYEEGFTIYKYNKKTKKTKPIHFEVYKRSASKSRTGQCLFVNKKLKAKMQNWSRMGLKFSPTKKHDLASLLAYESLVTSSLEGMVTINTGNMLIIDDVDSKFPELCSVVRKNEQTGLLDSFPETVEVSNSLFDGESLLDAEFFPEGKSMLLLRQHMFKSAAFNTNIQKFFTDQHKAMTNPKNENYDSSIPVNYDEWEVRDLFGNPVLLSNVKFIYTPSSLKALKFSYVKGSKAEMYDYWRGLVDAEGSKFGVCKAEKSSKFERGKNGEILHQTSYQHLNSLPLSQKKVNELVENEQGYIMNLKNDDATFIKHIQDKANNLNSNEMLSAIYNVNEGIVNTEEFKKFRREEINKQKKHVQKGKVLVNADYLTLLGNPVEYLYHALSKFDTDEPKSLELHDNEIYTTLFPTGKEYVGFRNPHTAPSNVFVGKSVHNEAIKNYFNLSDNIICVNAIDHNIQNKLSGCDYDSDTLVLVDFDEEILEIAKRLNKDYPVCVNKIDSDPTFYKLDKANASMAKVDNTLSVSQKVIGQIVNKGQLYMSLYWDKKNNDASEETLEELLKGVDILTVLSGIAIDMSKRMYDLDLPTEIDVMDNKLELKLDPKDDKRKKPLFWKVNGSKDKKKKKADKKEKTNDKNNGKKKPNKFVKYDTTMDYLFEALEGLKYADSKDKVEFNDLLAKVKKSDGDRHQRAAILEEVEEMSKYIMSINSDESNLNDSEKDEYQLNVMDKSKYKIEKKDIKIETMVSTIEYALDPNNKYVSPLRLLKVLYETHTEVFLEAFKK